MTPEVIWKILESLISGAFAAGGAYGAVVWRFRAIEHRLRRLEEDVDRAEERIDSLLLRKRHANS